MPQGVAWASRPCGLRYEMTPLQLETLPLLLEVGCEEIPARFLRDAQKSLGERVLAALAEARLLAAADGCPVGSVGHGQDGHATRGGMGVPPMHRHGQDGHATERGTSVPPVRTKV